MIELLAIVALISILAAVFDFGPSRNVRKNVQRSVEGQNLRSIGQAMIAEESNKPGALTAGDLPDVYAMAAKLARDGAMTDPSLWYSKIDQGAKVGDIPLSIINTAAPGEIAPINPQFQGSPLAFAVALFPAGTDFLKLPPTTPIAWTRGLRADGTWRDDAPYGDWGGFIVFADGSMKKYKLMIEGQFIKFGGGHLTDDIREVLPPGTRISEYLPTPAKSR